MRKIFVLVVSLTMALTLIAPALADTLVYTNPSPYSPMQSVVIDVCMENPGLYTSLKVEAQFVTTEGSRYKHTYTVPMTDGSVANETVMSMTYDDHRRFRGVSYVASGMLLVGYGHVTYIPANQTSQSDYSMIPLRVWGVE